MIDWSFFLLIAAGFGLGTAYAHRRTIVDVLCEWRWLVGEGDEFELPASRSSVRVVRGPFDWEGEG